MTILIQRLSRWVPCGSIGPFAPVAPLLLLAALAVPQGGCVHARTVETPQEVEEQPTTLFRPDAIEELQEALIKEGYPIERTGKLDEQTQQALRSYQRRNGMVETGLPDQATLRRLSLDPDQIYQHSPKV